jgi:hypothetical protein
MAVSVGPQGCVHATGVRQPGDGLEKRVCSTQSALAVSIITYTLGLVNVRSSAYSTVFGTSPSVGVGASVVPVRLHRSPEQW